MLKHIFIIIALLVSANAVLGCKKSSPQISGFETGRFVFIGEVVGVKKLKKNEFEKADRDAIGLKVKVVENVSSPVNSADYFEVFLLHLTPNCRLESYGDELLTEFPVGSQVRVVAREAVVLKSKNVKNAVIRLEASFHDNFSVVINDLAGSPQISADSFYDYSSFVEKERTASAENVHFDSNYYLPGFELQKDLLRLENAKSKDDKIKILQRLIFYPHYEMDYSSILRNYITDKAIIEDFEQRRKQMLQYISDKRRQTSFNNKQE